MSNGMGLQVVVSCTMGAELDGSPSPRYPVSGTETSSINSNFISGGIFSIGEEQEVFSNLAKGWTWQISALDWGSELWIVERKLLCAALLASLCVLLGLFCQGELELLKESGLTSWWGDLWYAGLHGNPSMMRFSYPGMWSFSRIGGFNLFSASLPKDLLYPRISKMSYQPTTINQPGFGWKPIWIVDRARCPARQRWASPSRGAARARGRSRAGGLGTMARAQVLVEWLGECFQFALDLYIVFSCYPWSFGLVAEKKTGDVSAKLGGPCSASSTLPGLRSEVFNRVRIFTGLYKFDSANGIWKLGSQSLN